MGRRLEFDRDDAVEQVMNLIWRDGYKAASVKAVSEMLGLTRSSYYNAFGSREALFTEVLHRYVAIAPDRELLDLPEDAPVKPVITMVLKRLCQERAADPESRGCLAVNCIGELVGVDRELGPMLEGAYIRSIDALEALLRAGIRTGELEKTKNIRAKAIALKALIFGLNTSAKVLNNEKDLWAAAREGLRSLDLLHE